MRNTDLHRHLLSNSIRSILRLQLRIEDKAESRSSIINRTPQNETVVFTLDRVEGARVWHIGLDDGLEDAGLDEIS